MKITYQLPALSPMMVTFGKVRSWSEYSFFYGFFLSPWLGRHQRQQYCPGPIEEPELGPSGPGCLWCCHWRDCSRCSCWCWGRHWLVAWYVAGVQTKEAKWSEPVVDRNHNQVVVEEVLWSVPFGDCPTQLIDWKNTKEESSSLYHAPAPEVSPPPWIQTRTGRGCWGWVEKTLKFYDLCNHTF